MKVVHGGYQWSLRLHQENRKYAFEILVIAYNSLMHFKVRK